MGKHERDEEVKIYPLDINKVIRPIWSEKDEKNIGGFKLACLASPGKGKSTLVKALMYAKQDFIHTAKIMSGSEGYNDFYKKFCPRSFIHEDYDEEALEAYVNRQKIAKQNCRNPWVLSHP